MVLAVAPKNAFAADATMLTSPANYSAPTGDPGTVKIQILDLTGTAATSCQYILVTGQSAVPVLGSALPGGTAVFTQDTAYAVAAGQDHLLLLAIDGGSLIQAYADIDITGLLTSTTNYSAPIKGQAANTTKITYLNPTGISGATKWMYTLGVGSMAPPALGSALALAQNYTVNTDIPVAAGKDHLLLLATDNGGLVKAYAYIDITGLISSRAADLTGGGTHYSNPVPGSAIGTTKIATLTLPTLIQLPTMLTVPTKWQYKVIAATDTYVPAADSILTDVDNPNYAPGGDIPITVNQHLLLLAIDDDGKIKAYANLHIAGEQIEPEAASLEVGTNYSLPVPGLTPGTTKINTLNLVTVTDKWQYKVQASDFPPPPLGITTLTGFADYTVNTDISITTGQHLMLIETDAGGAVKAYADLTIGSGQINCSGIQLSTPANYSIPVPGSAGGNTRIAALNTSGILGATQWRYKVQVNALTTTTAPVYNSTAGAPDYSVYTTGADITVPADRHLILVATDEDDRIKAYADISILASYIKAADLIGGGTDYSNPVAGGAGGNTKIGSLADQLDIGASKWWYKVKTGAFIVPSLDSTLSGELSGAHEYTEGADIPIIAGQHLMLLATDTGGKIKGFVDLVVGAGDIESTPAAAVLATPANYSLPEAGTAPGSTKITPPLDPTGISGATKWRYAVQNSPYPTPALDADNTGVAGFGNYSAGTDILNVSPGQHLVLLATDADDWIKAFVDITLTAGQIRAGQLNLTTNYTEPEPGSAGGTTKIANLTNLAGISEATKWQYALQATNFDLPTLDSNLAGARDYPPNADIPASKDQRLVLLATDDTGKIKASTYILLTNAHIRAYDLTAPANYSTPVSGTAAGTTKIITFNLSSITGATKLRYKIQEVDLVALPALDSSLADTTVYTAGSDINVFADQYLILLATDDDGKIKAYADITLVANQIKSAAELSPDFITESEIRAGFKTITINLTLSGPDFSWASDLTTTPSKKNLLFDNMTAGGSEASEWAKVIGNLKTAANPLEITGDVLTITLPITASYNITADQTINVSVPSSLLQTSGTVTLVPSTFTIKTDSAVNITGTITSATAADIRKGGKTIIVTLVNPPGNDTWHSGIATQTDRRQALFSALAAAGGEAAKWNGDVIDALKASATIVRTSGTVVTITLPAVTTYNITANQSVQLSNIPALCLTSNNNFTPSSPAGFTVTPAGSSAAITGTIVGTTTLPTADVNIVAGGNTIIFTLSNDTWAYDIASNLGKYISLLNSLTVSSGATGEDAQWTEVMTALKSAGTIVRTSDAIVTATLPAAPTYHITAPQTITSTIPANLVGSGVSPLISSTFTIYPVTAAVSGTVVSAATVQSNIVSGGKTIIITLSKGTWASDVVTNALKFNQLIEGIRLATGDPLGTPDPQWQKIRTALKNSTGKIKVSGAVLTITLPPVTDYFISTGQTVTVTINKNLLKLPTAQDLLAAPTFKIYTEALPPATATVTFDPSLSVTDIKTGTAKSVVTITLLNDTWIGDIISNRNNLVKLLDSFTAAADTDQWTLVKTTIKNDINALSKTNDSIINITIPAVNGYNIASDQVITIKIPKALLNLTKADLAVTPTLTIKAEVKGNLDSLLQDGGLDTLLGDGIHSPSNIYVTVPKKYLNRIDMANSELGSSKFTSLDVNAETEVNTILVNAGGVVRTCSVFSVVKEKRVFNLAFSGLENDSDITFAAFSDAGCTVGLGKEVTVKVAAGNTVPYPPKGASSKSLAGSYTLQSLISNSKLFSSILLQYTLDELTVTTLN